MEKNIAITGLGIVSNHGYTEEDYWNSRKSKDDKSKEISTFDTSACSAKMTFPINDFKPKEFIKRRFIKPLDEVTRYCIAASGLVVNDANLENCDKSRCGLIAGSKYHGIFSIFNIKEGYQEGGVDEVSPVFFPGTVFNASAAQAAIEWGLTGPNGTVNTGTASGMLAVIKGNEYVQVKRANQMIAGGNEMLFDYIMHKYDRLGLLSHNGNGVEKCRPFDKARNGTILGEGACYFAIETIESAQNRKVPVYAQIKNYACNYSPDEKMAFETFCKCMQDSVTSEESKERENIDLIIADGSGDPKYDQLQAEAIRQTFGSIPYVTSNKGSIGHTLGASGAFNILDGILSIKNQGILPVQNLNDPEVNLNYVTKYIEAKINTVLVTSFDPYGNNACILLQKV